MATFVQPNQARTGVGTTGQPDTSSWMRMRYTAARNAFVRAGLAGDAASRAAALSVGMWSVRTGGGQREWGWNAAGFACGYGADERCVNLASVAPQYTRPLTVFANADRHAEAFASAVAQNAEQLRWLGSGDASAAWAIWRRLGWTATSWEVLSRAVRSSSAVTRVAVEVPAAPAAAPPASSSSTGGASTPAASRTGGAAARRTALASSNTAAGAARDLDAYVRSNSGRVWDSTGRPVRNDRVAAAQRAMGGLTADGLYGPATRARMQALGVASPAAPPVERRDPPPPPPPPPPPVERRDPPPPPPPVERRDPPPPPPPVERRDPPPPRTTTRRRRRSGGAGVAALVVLGAAALAS